MTNVTISKDLPEEFFSDILITAFDGNYGWSWNWFEPSTGPNGDKFWLLTKNDSGHNSTDNPWMQARVRLHEETGDPRFDGVEFLVDHEVLAKGISRIINEDYEGVWRPATDKEKADYLDGHTFRETRETEHGLEVHTGETARGQFRYIVGAVTEEDAGDIDAVSADAIVQVGLFGKVIFS